MITTTRADTLSGRFFFLFVSIFLNAFSNALTVSTNMGSAIWTASAVNLSHWVLRERPFFGGDRGRRGQPLFTGAF